MKWLLFILLSLMPASALAQTVMGNVPMPPNFTQGGFTAAASDQAIVPAPPNGVVWTFIWIFNYGPPDYNSNATLWVTFNKPCTPGAGGAIQIPPGDDRVFGGVRAQASAQNVPQASIHVCTSASTAIGGYLIQ